jgi:cytochrome c-type biogenesis protein CcmH
MRAIIRERLEAGQSEHEVLAYFVSVYGDSVLAAPPRRGFWLIAWLVPPLAIASGVVVVFFTVRALHKAPAPATGRQPPTPAAEAAAEDVELGRYLKLVDQELGGVREKGTMDKNQQRGQRSRNG